MEQELLDAKGRYVYREDLLRLDKKVPVGVVTIPKGVGQIVTPLQSEVWARELHDHPDEVLVGYIVNGIRQGFRIGFGYLTHSCSGASRNMVSHPQPIQQYIERERGAGRIIGPLDSGVRVHISRFGVILKPHQPGKWRFITDLSSPEGVSVNDGIDPRLCSVNYISVDDAASAILHLGRGAMLAKFDLESAYRLVPVHPQDRLLLGEMGGRDIIMWMERCHLGYVPLRRYSRL